MTRKYSFEYRRRHPKMFPEVCDVCKPKRRFRAPANKVQHEESIQQQRIYDHPMHRTKSSVSYPPSSSSLSTITASDLNKFVKKEIEPDTEYNKSCKEVVDCLCQFMKNEFPDELRVSEIVKSESLGKGKTVKGKSDADLVVFLARFDSIIELYKSIKEILDRMKSSLDNQKDFTVERTTAHAVKVSLSGQVGHSHDVDILPSVKVNLQGRCMHRIEPTMCAL
ncbi:2'-5'-oligoadenylate synthase 3-like [Ostrea edulis]|uniref:2'-5'-oligoadenylate synthase 3-like n=1 Tax=Ostrea edulis TaxID=37623 RepID=UPI0024AF9DEA|nr:2'-5'-oligoadenylate synthase 3-like [Ostrea edulis]